MLEIDELSLISGSGSSAQILLHEISAQFSPGKLVALYASTPRERSALLECIAGIHKPTSGQLGWQSPNFLHCEVALIPAADYTQDFLTVRESLANATALRIPEMGAEESQERLEKILLEIGLFNIADSRVGQLTEEQKRRLKLGIELVTSPKILLCDQITCELAPRMELAILNLLRQIATERQCVVLLATDALRHLQQFDSILVLQEGHLAYHGAAEFLFHYFNIQTADELPARLGQRKPGEWHRSWCKHRAAYYSAQTDAYQPVLQSEEDPEQEDLPKQDQDKTGWLGHPLVRAGTASKSALPLQLRILLGQRWKEAIRNRSGLLLQLTFLVVLPCVVILFAWGALPRLVAASGTTDGPKQLVGLLSGLAMFQAILMSFAGMLNGSREIVSERAFLEKEKNSGLSPLGYLGSKMVFLGALAVIQSFWMTFFVKMVCHFPGNPLLQGAALLGVNLALTAICLALSAFSTKREKAHLVGLYLVAAQLPLSGIILALPDWLAKGIRVLDSAVWGWSGLMEAMGISSSAFHVPFSCSMGVLLVQILFGAAVAYYGIQRKG